MLLDVPQYFPVDFPQGTFQEMDLLGQKEYTF